MMELKYSICCGLDVHKNVIVATIATTNSKVKNADKKDTKWIADLYKFDLVR